MNGKRPPRWGILFEELSAPRQPEISVSAERQRFACATRQQGPFVYAEIGCNHKGELETALAMVQAAARCGVQGVKFQKREPSVLLSRQEYDAPHPVPRHAYGPTYGLHRKALELDLAAHAVLRDHARLLGVAYGCSVWDTVSATGIAALRPDWMKIPSASNTDLELVETVYESFSGPVHISLGMTARAEEEALVDAIRRMGRMSDTVLYACTSGYPVPASLLCLGEITRLQASYGNEACAIGFSGHHTSTAPDIAALALGARYIERHFTLDRSWRGTDHAASLEPDDLQRLCSDLKEVAPSLGMKEREILAIEEPQRAKLKRLAGQHPVPSLR